MEKLLKENFIKQYGYEPETLFSCGGRFEILGNHTDHNHGKCLAGTCSLSIYSSVKKRNDNIVRVYSEGFSSFEVDLSSLDKKEEEVCTSNSLVRGVASELHRQGYKIGGMDIYMYSKVPGGAGVSSSAAFELLVAGLFSKLYNDDKIDRLVLCKASQYAERNYYGKMCGLLDQIGVGYGGAVYIDFEDITNPMVEPLEVNLDGYHFLIVNSGGSHAGLDHLYKALPDDMFKVANFFNQQFLRDISKEEVIEHKEEIINQLGERAYLRAMHFYTENERVEEARYAIKNNDLDTLIKLMNESCESSTNKLGNMMVDKIEGSPLEACQLINKVAGNKAGVKINGGGFAGSVISLIKDEVYKDVLLATKERYGEDHIFEISIKSTGPCKL